MTKAFELNKTTLDLYSDCLISSIDSCNAVGFASLMGQSHDSISRFMGGIKFNKTGRGFVKNEYTSKDLWKLVKPTIREQEYDNGIIVIDDTIEEKMYSDENEVICWHYDHVFSRNVKGLNLLNFLYLGKELITPISFEIVKKTVQYCDLKNRKVKRKSPITKNQMVQDNINQICKNHVQFKYILIDSWFCCNETLELINNHHKNYVVPLKSNRKIAVTLKNKLSGQWQKLDNPEFNQQLQDATTPIEIWLEGLDHSVFLIKKVFMNQDESTGEMYLITNDKTLQNQPKEELYKVYQKRWSIEEFHKSIKSNLGLSKSPTKNPITQANHFFCTIYSYHKLELLTKTTKFKNHFQLKASILTQALRSAFQELTKIKQLISIPCER